jgi:RHS repeat-associated protein
VTSGACTGTTAAYQYDASGNTTERPVNGASGSGGAEGLTWNSQGLLDTVTTTSGSTTSTTKHVYDTDGNLLIRRDTSGETVLYLGDTEVHLDTAAPGGHVWAERYYTANGAAVAVRSNQTGSQTLSYLASDQHGTSTLAWDATTQSVTKRYFTAFGASRNGGTGTWPDDKSFLGASADQDTGLTYLGAREYDPTTGRFLSVDPLLQTDRPQTLNGYTYAGNNPASFSDPSGKGLKCGQGDTPCPPVNPQDVYNATPKSSGTSGTSSTGSHGDTSGQGSGAPYAPDPYSEGNEYNPADFQPLPGVPDYVPAGVASSRYLQQRECAISPIELACNPQDADLDCADCGGLRRVGLKWALGKLDYFDESDYGEDSPVAHELERTDLVAKQRSEIARDYLTRGEMAGKLKSYSIASLKSPFARFLSDTRSILTGKGDVATAVLGSYTSEFQVLRSSPRGIQVRVTVNDDMTISSFAHVITGYNTPASRYLQNNVDGSGISLSDADGLGAGRSLSITFREVIRF